MINMVKIVLLLFILLLTMASNSPGVAPAAVSVRLNDPATSSDQNSPSPAVSVDVEMDNSNDDAAHAANEPPPKKTSKHKKGRRYHQKKSKGGSKDKKRTAAAAAAAAARATNMPATTAHLPTTTTVTPSPRLRKKRKKTKANADKELAPKPTPTDNRKGDSAELMPLDNSLNQDMHMSVIKHATLSALAENPKDSRIFSLRTPKEIARAYLRVTHPTLGVAPKSKRILQDIDKVIPAMKKIVEAKGVYVPGLAGGRVPGDRNQSVGDADKRGGFREYEPFANSDKGFRDGTVHTDLVSLLEESSTEVEVADNLLASLEDEANELDRVPQVNETHTPDGLLVPM